MKKISKLIIALLMAFLFVLNVNALTPNVSSDTGSITVTNVGSSDTFKAYKILNTTYDSGTNTIGYTFTTDFQAFLTATNRTNFDVDDYLALTGGDITTGQVNQNNQLDALMSEYAAYIKAHNVSGETMTVTTTNNVSSATKTGLAPGAYLVLPTTTNRVYAVMVGNIAYTAANNDWTLNNASIEAKVSDPSINKTFDETGNPESYSYAWNENHTYVINATIPTYPANATNKAISIVDTLGNGLTHAGMSSVHVYDGATELTVDTGTGAITDSGSHNVGTVTISGQIMTVTLNADYLNSTDIKVEYDAALNSNSVLGPTGNTNTVKMTYSNDPYGSGTADTPNETTSALTYGIKVYKTDNAATPAPLAGAVFAIYAQNDSTCSSSPIATLSATDSTGYANKDGLAEGTYYVKEVSAPAGYRSDTICRPVTTSTSNADGYTTLTVENVPMGLLPSTGGIGTYIYIAAGALLVVAVITVAVVYTRKNKEEK